VPTKESFAQLGKRWSKRKRLLREIESLEPSKGHLLVIPLHNTLQKVRGYAVRLRKPHRGSIGFMIGLI
jgi:hypothetical protein